MTYLEFYGLQKEPFSVTPDPEFLFLSPSHREALASIVFGITKRKGIIVITGEVGVGKTTVLRSYLETAASENQKVVYIFHSDLNFLDVLHEIYQAMEVPIHKDNQHDLVQGLHKMLIDEYSKGSNVVLIVDEAQNMPVSTLESLRMLSNLETPKDKLIQIVLIGQPELEEKLDLHELRQLKQRIAMRTKIMSLTEEESRNYIEHRLERAGAVIESVFRKGAIRELVKRSEGIPRVINILADGALITGYGYQQSPISASVIKEVSSDVRGQKKEERVFTGFKWLLIPLAAVLLAATLWIGKDQVGIHLPAKQSSTEQVPDNSAILRKERELRKLEEEASRRSQELKIKTQELEAAQQKQLQDLDTRAKKQQDTESAWAKEEARRKSELAQLQKQYNLLKQQVREASVAANKPPSISSGAGTAANEQKSEPARIPVTTPQSIAKSPPAKQNAKPHTIETYAHRTNPAEQQKPANQERTPEPIAEEPETGPDQLAWVVPNSPALEQKQEQQTSRVNVAPKILQYVPPAYPYSALMRGVEGIVTLEVHVTEEGAAEEIHVVEGIDELNSAAIAAVRRWRFSPASRNGIPTDAWMTYRIAFRHRN